MGVGSLLYVHFILVEQIGPDQPGICHSLGLGHPVHTVLVASHASFLAGWWSGHQRVTHVPAASHL